LTCPLADNDDSYRRRLRINTLQYKYTTIPRNHSNTYKYSKKAINYKANFKGHRKPHVGEATKATQFSN